MRHLGLVARLARAAALLAVSLSVSLSAAAAAARAAIAPTAGDLAQCAGIAAPDARLVCYDTLAGRPADRATAPATATATATATAAAPALPAAKPPASAGDVQRFGFTQAQLHAAPQGPEAIHARIARITEDKLGHASVLLDNGQTWTFTDEDGRLSAGNPVTIKRAALGSYLMTTPSRRSYTVHRTQ